MARIFGRTRNLRLDKLGGFAKDEDFGKPIAVKERQHDEIRIETIDCRSVLASDHVFANVLKQLVLAFATFHCSRHNDLRNPMHFGKLGVKGRVHLDGQLLHKCRSWRNVARGPTTITFIGLKPLRFVTSRALLIHFRQRSHAVKRNHQCLGRSNVLDVVADFGNDLLNQVGFVHHDVFRSQRMKDVVDDGVAVHKQMMNVPGFCKSAHDLGMVFDNVGKVTWNAHVGGMEEGGGIDTVKYVDVFIYFFLAYSISTCVNMWRRQHTEVKPKVSKTCPSTVFSTS